MAPKPKPLVERFWPKVDRRGDDECWPWLAHRVKGGYGEIRRGLAGSKNERAHRVAWEIAHGEGVPSGMLVCHSCDNPPCCNPAHLFLGTPLDNMADKERKGRGFRTFGTVNGQAKLKEDDVMHIRSMYETGNYSQRELGELVGLSQPAICRVVGGKRWPHLPI